MFQRLLVGFDGTPQSRDALRFAGLIAAPTSAVTVATIVVERAATGFAAEVDALAGTPANDRALLDEARAILGGRDDVAYVAPVAASVAAGLHQLAVDGQADLIVVGSSRHHGAARRLLGSDAEQTLHEAPCAVCVVPGAAPTGLRAVGTGYDGTALSQPASDTAAGVAAHTDASLTVLTVADTEHPFVAYDPGGDLVHDGRMLLGAEVERLSAVTRARPLLQDGDPAVQLIALSGELDLLVLGGRARGPAMRLLLGDVSGRVVREAACPVMVVPENAGVADASQRVEVPLVRRGVSW